MRRQLHAWSEYLRLWRKQWRNPYKRGNRFPVSPLRDRLIMAHRMGMCGRMIVLGPPYRSPRWLRMIGVSVLVLPLVACQPGSGVKITDELVTAIVNHCESMGNINFPGSASVSWKCTPTPVSGGATVSVPVSVGVVAVPAR